MANCVFKDDAEKAERLKAFLREHGDALPESALESATSGQNLANWVTICDEANKLISGVTYENNDWFLCTFHYLATDKAHRGKGLGTRVATGAVENAKANLNCLVLAADITFDNDPSKRIFEKLGFEEKTRFCWGKGEKPADILHYVRMPPDGTECRR